MQILAWSWGSVSFSLTLNNRLSEPNRMQVWSSLPILSMLLLAATVVLIYKYGEERAPARAPPAWAMPRTAPSPSTAPEANPELLSAVAAEVTLPSPLASTPSRVVTSTLADRAVATSPKNANTVVFIFGEVDRVSVLKNKDFVAKLLVSPKPVSMYICTVWKTYNRWHCRRAVLNGELLTHAYGYAQFGPAVTSWSKLLMSVWSEEEYLFGALRSSTAYAKDFEYGRLFPTA